MFGFHDTPEERVGALVDPARIYTVAMNEFLATGGDGGATMADAGVGVSGSPGTAGSALAVYDRTSFLIDNTKKAQSTILSYAGGGGAGSQDGGGVAGLGGNIYCR